MATWLRRKFEAEFDERYDRLMDLLVEVRAEARYVLGTSEVAGWNEALDDGIFELVASGEVHAARQQLRSSIGLDAPTSIQAEAAGADVHPAPPTRSSVLRANGSANLEPKVTA